jgi:excisionase family DNA binding protein
MANTGLFIIRIEEAADILNVSVDYVRRLELTGKLRFHGRTDHYRLDVVLAYKEADDIRRNKALKELVQLTEAYGGYDDDKLAWAAINADRERLVDLVRD